MSNNRDVTYKGVSCFFTLEKTKKIRNWRQTSMSCSPLRGKSDLYISVTAKAKLIRDKTSFVEHWVKDLDT
jgi:general stress protein 26